MEFQFFDDGAYKADNLCLANFKDSRYNYKEHNENTLFTLYAIGDGEDMCPRDYGLGVATQSWGACLCWENGARRSKWGKSAKCEPVLPLRVTADTTAVATCPDDSSLDKATKDLTEDDWCTAKYMSDFNQVCAPSMGKPGYAPGRIGESEPLYCIDKDAKAPYGDLPEGID